MTPIILVAILNKPYKAFVLETLIFSLKKNWKSKMLLWVSACNLRAAIPKSICPKFWRFFLYPEILTKNFYTWDTWLLCFNPISQYKLKTEITRMQLRKQWEQMKMTCLKNCAKVQKHLIILTPAGDLWNFKIFGIYHLVRNTQNGRH